MVVRAAAGEKSRGNAVLDIETPSIVWYRRTSAEPVVAWLERWFLHHINALDPFRDCWQLHRSCDSFLES